MNKVWLLLVLVLFMMLSWPGEAKKIPNPYKVLGIDQNANEDQIKAAFKRRSRKYHPDRNKEDPRAKQKFAQVVNAYELLKDPEKRRIYDQTGGEDPNSYQQQFRQGGGGFGFPGGGGGFGFPGGGFGINIQDIMRGFGGGGFRQGHPGGFQGHPGGFHQGHPGGQQHHSHRQGRQRSSQQRQRATYSFSFGGQQGANFQF